MTGSSYGWNRSVEARGDSLLSSRRMQMTTCVSCWHTHKIKQQQDQRRNHHGPLEGCGKQQGSMRKPGILPARIPEITTSSLHGMTLHPDTLKQTPTTPGHNKVVRKLPQWNRRVKLDLRRKRRRGNSTQGTLRVRSVLLLETDQLMFFFPSDASWLPSGRSTCSRACCSWN